MKAMFRQNQNNPVRSGRLPFRLQYDLAAPLLSALLLCLSFNWYRGQFLAAFALIPLLAAAERSSCSRAFRQGLIAGFVFYFIELHWIGQAISTYTSLPGFLVNPVLCLLALYLGFYVALFSSLWQFFRVFESKRVYVITAILAAAAGWLLLEDIRSRLLGGFPWHPLALTQVDMPGVKGLFAYGGVRLISALIIMVNAGFYLLLENIRQNRPWQLCKAAILLLLILTAVFFIPGYRLPPENPTGTYGKPLRVTIIQPNILQGDKWRREKRPAIIEKMLSISTPKDQAAIDLMVWPEASLPLFLVRNGQVFKRLLRFVRHYNLHLMVGGPGYAKPTRKQPATIYNSTFLISPNGKLHTYNKVKLVPFGEVTPLVSIFPFLNKVVPGPDCTPGAGVKNFVLGEQKFAPSICFEGIFPVFTARFFAAGAGFLVSQTNDSWFGKSQGPLQHLKNLRLRALENRCYIIRSANTGISAVIDPGGRVVKSLNLNQSGYLEAVVYPCLKPTFYAQHPYLPTIIALLILCLSPIFVVLKKIKSDN